MKPEQRTKEKQMKNMTQKQAGQVAKDLIEGGVDDPLTITVNLSKWGITIQQARKIKKVLCKYDVRKCDRWMFEGDRYFAGAVTIEEKTLGGRLSMLDAISNGWENETLGIVS